MSQVPFFSVIDLLFSGSVDFFHSLYFNGITKYTQTYYFYSMSPASLITYAHSYTETRQNKIPSIWNIIFIMKPPHLLRGVNSSSNFLPLNGTFIFIHAVVRRFENDLLKTKEQLAHFTNDYRHQFISIRMFVIARFTKFTCPINWQVAC